MKTFTYYQHKLHSFKYCIELAQDKFYKLSLAKDKNTAGFKDQFDTYFDIGNQTQFFKNNWKEAGWVESLELNSPPAEIELN